MPCCLQTERGKSGKLLMCGSVYEWNNGLVVGIYTYYMKCTLLLYIYTFNWFLMIKQKVSTVVITGISSQVSSSNLSTTR